MNDRRELEMSYGLLLNSLASQIALRGWKHEICQDMEKALTQLREILDGASEARCKEIYLELAPLLLETLMKTIKEGKDGQV